MKKIVSLVLVLMMALVCASAAVAEGVPADQVKVGYIYIGDENEGYTAAHYEGAKEMMQTLGLTDDQVVIKWCVPETEACYDAAVDLAEAGCNIIIANSFGHESYVMQAAAEYPEIQFCHATGFQAASSGLANMHNYFTSIYEALRLRRGCGSEAQRDDRKRHCVRGQLRDRLCRRVSVC